MKGRASVRQNRPPPSRKLIPLASCQGRPPARSAKISLNVASPSPRTTASSPTARRSSSSSQLVGPEPPAQRKSSGSARRIRRTHSQLSSRTQSVSESATTSGRKARISWRAAWRGRSRNWASTTFTSWPCSRAHAARHFRASHSWLLRPVTGSKRGQKLMLAKHTLTARRSPRRDRIDTGATWRAGPTGGGAPPFPRRSKR